jgi:hypothetical protein
VRRLIRWFKDRFRYDSDPYPQEGQKPNDPEDGARGSGMTLPPTGY